MHTPSATHDVDQLITWLDAMPPAVRALVRPAPPSDAVPGTLDEVRAWLGTMDPIVRAKLCSVLAQHPTIWAEERRDAIYEATRTAEAADVAAALGVTTSAISKAVKAHNRAHGTGRQHRSTPASGTE
jgi:hypothetical protein